VGGGGGGVYTCRLAKSRYELYVRTTQTVLGSNVMYIYRYLCTVHNTQRV
jgi:hypothetical protein